MKNPVVWVELPVTDMDRAVNFYNTAFGWQLTRMPMGPLEMAVFPRDDNAPGISGALVHHKDAYSVSDDDSGPLIYLHTEDIDQQLKNIENAGGIVLLPKKLIDENYGSMALFRDSENNRMALFSSETS